MQAKAHAPTYRRALAQFATGVTVVTTRDAHGNPIGPDGQFVQLGFARPAAGALELGAARRARSPPFERCKHYAVNVLAGDQLEVAQALRHPRRRSLRTDRLA